MGIQFIGVSEVENYLNKENVEFIDLRDTKEYRKKHIRGAISMPYDSFMKEFATLSKKKIYILYCDRGAMSILAVSAMQKSGYRCMSLAGGIKAFE